MPKIIDKDGFQITEAILHFTPAKCDVILLVSKEGIERYHVEFTEVIDQMTHVIVTRLTNLITL